MERAGGRVRRGVVFALVAVGLLLSTNSRSEASCWRDRCYTATEHPIVLVHGLSGFDRLFGAYPYFFGIERALRSGGATVYVTEASQFQSSEARGEQLVAQLDSLAGSRGHQRFNLIGHSQGGIDIRYVAAVRPDLVASVTTVASPHRGSAIADLLRSSLRDGGLLESIAAHFAESLGTLLALLSGTENVQDAIAALEQLTSDGMAAFNQRYPQALPSTRCGQGEEVVNGVHYFSWTGTGIVTSPLDVLDLSWALTSVFFDEPNDGLVGQCSARLGTVLRDDYRQNHLDAVNQTVGLVSLFDARPTTVYRTHANRLKRLGL